jgi:hypothetical protein
MKSSGISLPNHILSLTIKLLIMASIPMRGQATTPELVITTSSFKAENQKPSHGIRLDPKISEGSGLVAWNGQIWTHNDSGSPRIFALDSSNGKLLKTFVLPVKNDDWEDINQDSHSLYIGNFGNNSGRKKCLQIYRISKKALLNGKVVLDSVSFEWPSVRDSGKNRKINFDCEAMVVLHDTIFLFTKEHKHGCRSRIFKIPAAPGNYTAKYVATLKTPILITGASYMEDTNRVVLCGYTWLLAPRLLAFSLSDSKDFKNVTDGKRIKVRRWLKQTEGVTTFDGINYYLISEAENFYLWKNKPKLYKIKIE